MVFLNLFSLKTLAADLDNDYPRLANYFLKWRITDQDAIELSKWDVIILGAQTQYFNPNAIRTMRRLNPDIKILAYLATESLHATDIDLNLQNPLRKLYNAVESHNWWLRDAGGDYVAFWPGTKMINISQTDWTTYLAQFASDEIMATGLWDGIYYDNAFEYVNWINDGDIDLNKDGRAESAEQLNSAWQKAMNNLFSQTRQKLGDKALIIINSSNLYLNDLNGRLLEGFPYGYENNWQNEMSLYAEIQSIENSWPIISINNGNTANVGQADDYQRMRFGLASTLMLDGYFSFDYGDKDHAQTWWYDEYDVFLDKALGEFYNINTNQQKIEPGIFRRDFSRGLVLLNSSQSDSRVRLDGEYEKIAGIQDPVINDGWRVTTVKLPAEDGLILIKPIQEVVDNLFINGSYLRVFNNFGEKIRSSFFAYDDNFIGGDYIVKKDLDLDGIIETVIARKNKIEIYKNDNLLKSFYPYTENYKGDVSFNLGDLDGDGDFEIVTGVANGGGPHVRMFDGRGNLINVGFFAYDKNFRGGVNITCGDLDGDGRDEIMTGANYGGGPHVRIFNGQGELKYPGFFAYDKNFRGGVNLASGDVDGDGLDEIITGMGRGGNSTIKVFDALGKLKNEFIGLEYTDGRGLQVFSNDFDGDGVDEVLVKVVF
jgi:hypothetical protein